MRVGGRNSCGVEILATTTHAAMPNDRSSIAGSRAEPRLYNGVYLLLLARESSSDMLHNY